MENLSFLDDSNVTPDDVLANQNTLDLEYEPSSPLEDVAQDEEQPAVNEPAPVEEAAPSASAAATPIPEPEPLVPEVSQVNETERRRRLAQYNEAQNDIDVLDSVSFYDVDENAKKKVQNSRRYGRYSLRSERVESFSSYATLGEDYLEAMERGGLIPAGASKMPREVAYAVASAMDNPEDKKKWLDELSSLDVRPKKPDVYDYYAVIAKMRKEKVTRQRELNAEMQKQDESLVQSIMNGDELSLEQEQHLSDFRRRVTPENYQDWVALHQFTKQYIAPLRQEESGETIARKLHDATEALYQFVGDNENRAKMAAQMLKAFSEEVKNSKKVSVLDEFVISIGRQLSAWNQQLNESTETRDVLDAKVAVQTGQRSVENWEKEISELKQLSSILDKKEDERSEAEKAIIDKYNKRYGSNLFQVLNLMQMDSGELKKKAEKGLARSNENLQQALSTLQERQSELEQAEARQGETRKKAVSLGLIKNALDTIVKLPDNQPWYWDYTVGAARVAAQAVGDTSLYIAGTAVGSAVGVPWLGMAVGSVGQMVQANTDTYDKLRSSGLTHEEARNEALTQGFINAAVEIIPGSSIGSIGFHRTLGWLASRGSNLAAQVVNWSNKSVIRGITTETLAGTVEEAIIEPTIAGFLTWGSAAIYDRFDVPHAKSREFRKCFDELSQMFDDPRQLVGILLFSAGMGVRESMPRLGGLLPEGGIRASVEYAKANAKLMKGAGLTDDQVERAQAQSPKKKESFVAQCIQDNWKNNPQETAERVLAANREEIQKRGAPLDFTGLITVAERDGKKYDVSAIRSALATQWHSLAMKGVLPFVSQNQDGSYHVEKGDFVKDLSAEQANAYLISEFNKYEQSLRATLRSSHGEDAANAVDLRAQLMDAVSKQIGVSTLESVRETEGLTNIGVEDVKKQLPDYIAKRIELKGAITYEDAVLISEWANGVIKAKGASYRNRKPTRGDLVTDTEELAKMSQEQRDAAISGQVMSFGDWSRFAANFVRRAQLDNKKKETARIPVFRTSYDKIIDGQKVLAQTLFTARDSVKPQSTLEDVTESVLTQMMDARAQEIRKQNKEISDKDAHTQAYDEMGKILEDAIQFISNGQQLPISKLQKKNGHYTPLSVREAMSSLAVSDFMYSDSMPEAIRQLQEFTDGLLDASSAISTVKKAFSAALANAKDNPTLAALQNTLNEMGGTVRTAFSRFRMDSFSDTLARLAEEANEFRAALGGGSPIRSVDSVNREVDERTAAIEQEKKLNETVVEGSTPTPAQVVEQVKTAFKYADPANVKAPPVVDGIFVDNQCIYNKAGAYFFGLVPKDKITQIAKQVKLGETGKHGEIKGKELVGKFHNDAPPLYLWLRKNGELVLISGRHRYDLMMRDKDVTSHTCYVYLEDAEHNEKWAELLDYECNMRDNQADERTCAYYIRQKKVPNDQLLEKGLLRPGSVAKRGLLIGREARENLYNLFMNGEIDAADAERICLLTKDLPDESRIENIQSECATLVKQKQSWDYIGSVLQLMAMDKNAKEEQGLLNLGPDFEKNLKQAAKYIEKVIANLRKGIQGIVQNKRNLADPTRKVTLQNSGVTVTAGEYDDATLDALRAELNKWLHVGSYSELVGEAYMADPDAKPNYSERISAEVAQQMLESGRATVTENVPEGQGSLNFSDEGSFSIEDAKEQDGDVSMNVRNLAAVHTLSVEKFLAAGKMGGMPLPSVAITRLDRPYRWGNEDKDVTLVGRPEMVDPEKGTQVYERDAWTGSIPQGAVEERDGRMVVNLGWGNYEEATPERLAELMEGRKRRGFEATSNWVDPKEAARAYLARRLRSMDEVKGMREKLSDEEERVVDDEEIEEWMESVSELGLTEQDWQSIFEALADLDEVTEESVREAIMRWEPEGDDFVELWDLKESDAMKEGSEFLQGAVRVISGLREEVRDYLEAVPQRAVKMNEWAYALYSENLEGKDEVRRVCRENGIVPVEYKEDARDEALWDLAYDGEVSFSIEDIREQGLFQNGVFVAANGVLIDRRGDDFSAAIENAQSASPNLYREPDLDYVGAGEGNQAQGWGLYWSTRWSTNRFYHNRFSTAGDPIKPGSKEERLIRLLAPALYVKKLDMEELDYLADDLEGDSSTPDRLTNVLKDRGFNEEDLAFFHEAIANMTIDIERRGLLIFDDLAPVADIKTRIDGEDISFRFNPDGGEFAVNYLADLDVDDSNVLHWDEPASRLFDEHPGLLEAYRDKGGEYTGKEKGQDIYRSLERLLGSDKAASQWLDARGIRGNKYLDGMSRRHESEEKMYNYVIFNEDYVKITRINNRHKWSEYSEDNPDWQRPDDVDFSELENIIDSVDFTSSMDEESKKEYVARILEGHIADGTGLACAREWTRFYDDYSVYSQEEESQSKNGHYMGRLLQLMAATWRNLPEQYKTGSKGFEVMRKWLKWYAEMNEKGLVTRSTEIKGSIYEKTFAAMKERAETWENIYTEEEKEAMIRAYSGKKASQIILSIAKKCRSMIDSYLKDSMKLDMLAEIDALYPETPVGEKIRKGKATADTYRYAALVKTALTMKGQSLTMTEKNEERINYLKNILQTKNDTLSDKKRLIIAAELDRLYEAVDNELQNAKNAFTTELLNTDDPERRDELEKMLHALMTFGGWQFKDVAEAQSAYLTFKKIIHDGRLEWQRLQQERKERNQYIMYMVRYKTDDPKASKKGYKNWKTRGQTANQDFDVSSSKGGDLQSLGATTGWSYTSFAGKLYAAEKKLGTWFVSRYTKWLAQMHVDLKQKQDEQLDWLYKTLSQVSGKHTLEGICDWVRDNDVNKETGIKLTRKNIFRVTVTKEQIEDWIAHDQSPKWVEAQKQALVDQQRTPDAFPSQEAFELMYEDYVNDQANKLDRKYYSFSDVADEVIDLKTTKWGCLQALLTAEQPFYEHLLDVNGLNEDKLEEVRNYLGPKLIEFGRLMREHLKEMRGPIAEMHERIYGLPFPEMENYFPGRFLHSLGTGPVNPDGQIVDVYGGLLPGRPDSFRVRAQHSSFIDWGISALDTFIQTQRQQDNWLITGDFIGEWASLLLDKQFSQEVVSNIGDQWYDKLRADFRALAQATLGEINLSAWNRLVGTLCRIQAMTYLPFSPRTSAKNAASIFNGYFAGRVPLKTIERNNLVQAVEERHIGFLEWLLGFFPGGKFSVQDIAKAPFIQVRKVNQKRRIQGAAHEAASKSELARKIRSFFSPVEGAALATQDAGMKPIEWSDIGGNVFGARALANAVYRSINKDEKMKNFDEETKKQIAIDYAMRALDYLAQPFYSSQKVTIANTKQALGTLADFSFYLFKSEQMAKAGSLFAGIMSGNWREGIHGASAFFLAGGAAWLFGRAMDYALGCAIASMTGKERQPIWGDLNGLLVDYISNGFVSDLESFPFIGDLIGEGIDYALGNPGYRFNNRVSDFLYAFRLFDKAKSTPERIRSVTSMLHNVGLAAVAAPYARPFASGLELLLAFSGLGNVVAQSASTVNEEHYNKKNKGKNKSKTNHRKLK